MINTHQPFTNLQHDVHEVFDFLIDKLHEDTNEVGVKPYVENPEGSGVDDVQISQLAWGRHALRHSSVVKDVVGGQIRSQLVCPDCGKVSATFDYFSTLNVAIPSTATFQILFVPQLASSSSSESQKNAEAYNFEINRSTPLQAIIHSLIKRINLRRKNQLPISQANLFIAELLENNGVCPVAGQVRNTSKGTYYTLKNPIRGQVNAAHLASYAGIVAYETCPKEGYFPVFIYQVRKAHQRSATLLYLYIYVMYM